MDRTNVSAQSQQMEKEKRQLENLIPKHIPLRVKIKKEKEESFNDLSNDKWARDFELEVTNTGEKPIYELYMLLWLPEIKAGGGYNVCFPLSYGRPELGDLRVKATPDDIPIQPGETIVLKIHPGNAEGFEIGQKEENRPQPKRVQLKFQILSFGDGTGYGADEGVALPRKISVVCLYQLSSSRRPSGSARHGALLRSRDRMMLMHNDPLIVDLA
jgi:hypothetical protein